MTSLLVCGKNVLDASYVCQRKLFPKFKSSSNAPGPSTGDPVQAAKRYLQALASAGLGDVETKGRQGVMSFKKSPWTGLSEGAREIIKKLKIKER